MKDTIAIYSGGMDSFTLVMDTHVQGRLLSCLSFDYYQRHRKELHYAIEVCAAAGIPHKVLHVPDLNRVFEGSSLTRTSLAVPEGHYAEDSMRQTVVPNRNAIMLSIAIAEAVSSRASRVVFGAHAGDHTIYPDCRPEFIDAISRVGMLANWHPVRVEAPYIHYDKEAILRIGMRLGLNYANSWTCYNGRDKACGKCGSCQERLEAFQRIGVKDPLPYEGA